RRCETQTPLSGKPLSAWLAFRSLDPFRALREPDRKRRDEKRPFRSEQKTGTNQNDYLTGKAPYKSDLGLDESSRLGAVPLAAIEAVGVNRPVRAAPNPLSPAPAGFCRTLRGVFVGVVRQ